MTDYQIHPDAPTDSDGHPIHPERGHRICARTKSDKTTPTSHGRERDDIPYCTLSAGWGVDGATTGACKHHGGASPTGKDNGNYKHGAYSRFLRQDLTDGEADALEGIVQAFDNPDDAKDLIKDQAAEAYIKYKRSGDERFLREYRQLVDTFNLAPNSDHLEVGASVNADVSHDVPADFVTYGGDDDDDEGDE